MTIVNAIPRNTPGVVGETRRLGKYTYKKSRNGKWELVITKAMLRQVYRCYVTHKGTIRSTANSLGLTHGTVNRLIIQNGWGRGKADLSAQNTDNLEKNKAAIVHRYRLGDSFQDIALQFGTTPGRVKRYLLHRGIPQRSHSSQAKKSVSKFKDSYLQALEDMKDNVIRRHSRFTEFASRKQYNSRIVRLTKHVVDKYKSLLDPLGKRSSEFNIDHQFSKFYGWYEFSKQQDRMIRRPQPIPLTIMCHPANLKLLPAAMNSAKGNFCHLSLHALKKKIREFDTKHGKVF